MKPQKVYWDSSCFISFISGDHPAEAPRASICEDILNNARNDEIQIFTSVWTIAETIRPKSPPEIVPLPNWAQLLNSKNPKCKLLFPEAIEELSKLWAYFHKGTAPSRILPEPQAIKIRQMFDWKWIRLVQVTPAIAHRSVEIARAHNMKPGDAIHVATALNRECEVIHRWDKDFSRTDSLVPSKDPEWMTAQPHPELPLSLPSLFLASASSELDNNEGTTNAQEGNDRETDSAHPAPVRGSDEGCAKSETAREATIQAAQAEAPEKPKAAEEGGLVGDVP